MAETAALLDVLEEVPITHYIWGAKSNLPQNLRLPYKLVDICAKANWKWYGTDSDFRWRHPWGENFSVEKIAIKNFQYL